jgi:hypothetical protein
MTVAVTGSAGKTSTEDLIAQLLPSVGVGPTVATEQSFDNEIGLPLPVSRATAGTRSFGGRDTIAQATSRRMSTSSQPTGYPRASSEGEGVCLDPLSDT